MSTEQPTYRIANLPGYGRVRVPAHMTDDEVLAALAADREE